MIRGIIFDYGGTIDSRGEHWSEVIYRGWQNAGIDVAKDLFRDCYVYAERELARNRHILPQHTFRELLYIKSTIELEYLCEQGYKPLHDIEYLADKIADYCDNSARACIDEARPTLEALSAHYPMMLVSNFYGNIDSVLRAYDIRHYFKGIIESAVVGIRKPDPTLFMLGVVALGLKPDETLVVGDSLKKDILPSESIGCHTAWLKGKGWTTDEDNATHPSQIQKLSDVIDPVLTELNRNSNTAH